MTRTSSEVERRYWWVGVLFFGIVLFVAGGIPLVDEVAVEACGVTVSGHIVGFQKIPMRRGLMDAVVEFTAPNSDAMTAPVFITGRIYRAAIPTNTMLYDLGSNVDLNVNALTELSGLCARNAAAFVGLPKAS